MKKFSAFFVAFAVVVLTYLRCTWSSRVLAVPAGILIDRDRVAG